MTNRSKQVVVTVAEPFALSGLDGAIPAGRYEVTTDEEPLGDIMYPGYRRISATIYLPRVPGRIGVSQNIELTSSELSALLSHADPILE
jgi:hypothetical protein